MTQGFWDYVSSFWPFPALQCLDAASESLIWCFAVQTPPSSVCITAAWLSAIAIAIEIGSPSSCHFIITNLIPLSHFCLIGPEWQRYRLWHRQAVIIFVIIWYMFIFNSWWWSVNSVQAYNISTRSYQKSYFYLLDEILRCRNIWMCM